MSQRMQSFVLDSTLNPFNVLEPGKRPRVTLTPSFALKDGKPFLSFAVQGGDTQDQNLLQFFLNVVEFGLHVQQATEAAMNDYGIIPLHYQVNTWAARKGIVYTPRTDERTYAHEVRPAP